MKRSKPISSSPPKRQSLDELRALQRLMARAIMRPLAPGQRMDPRWPGGRPARDVVNAFIKPGPRLPAFARLEIYNRQYWFRILDCFYDDFPGLRAVLGDRPFHALALAYLTRHPSTSFNLRNLGQSLVPFLIRRRASRLALDLARLEWAHIEAFDNAARPPFSVAQLQGRNPARLRLNLQPHLTLLSLKYPLDDYLIALRENDRFRGEASNAAEDSTRPRLRPPPFPRLEPIHLAVHRHRNVVHYKRLTLPQFRVLTALQSGQPLAAALHLVAPAAAPVQQWFQDWSALAWFWLTD